MDQLNELVSSSFVDLDTIFRPVTDKDYDLGRGGITRHSFCQNYRDWLVCCNRHRGSEDVSISLLNLFYTVREIERESVNFFPGVKELEYFQHRYGQFKWC